jgi:hypothetical protein
LGRVQRGDLGAGAGLKLEDETFAFLRWPALHAGAQDYDLTAFDV